MGKVRNGILFTVLGLGLAAASTLGSPAARAAEAVPHQSWSFSGPFGPFDRGDLQRQLVHRRGAGILVPSLVGYVLLLAAIFYGNAFAQAVPAIAEIHPAIRPSYSRPIRPVTPTE